MRGLFRRLRERIHRVRERATHFFFELDPDREDPLRRATIYVGRTLFLVLRGVLENRVSIWASSLTYLTLISAIPFIALVTGIGSRLGVPADLVDQFPGMPAGLRDVLVNAAAAFEELNLTALAFGSVTLMIYAAMRTLIRVERAMNNIWGVEQGRRLIWRILLHVSLVTVGPALLLGGLAVNASLRSSHAVEWLLALPIASGLLEAILFLMPILSVFVLLGLLYWQMPHARVRLIPAAAGALFSSVLYYVAQVVFIRFQVGISGYSAVYGAFAAIPIFMIWVYISWTIVLLGAEVTYGVQHVKAFGLDAQEEPGEEWLQRTGLHVVLLLADDEPGAAWSADRISETIDAPARVVNRALTRLEVAGHIREKNRGRFTLDADSAELQVIDVLDALSPLSAEAEDGHDVPRGSVELIRRVFDACRAPAEVTVRELLRSRDGEG